MQRIWPDAAVEFYRPIRIGRHSAPRDRPPPATNVRGDRLAGLKIDVAVLNVIRSSLARAPRNPGIARRDAIKFIMSLKIGRGHQIVNRSISLVLQLGAETSSRKMDRFIGQCFSPLPQRAFNVCPRLQEQIRLLRQFSDSRLAISFFMQHNHRAVRLVFGKLKAAIRSSDAGDGLRRTIAINLHRHKSGREKNLGLYQRLAIGCFEDARDQTSQRAACRASGNVRRSGRRRNDFRLQREKRSRPEDHAADNHRRSFRGHQLCQRKARSCDGARADAGAQSDSPTAPTATPRFANNSRIRSTARLTRFCAASSLVPSVSAISRADLRWK